MFVKRSGTVWLRKGRDESGPLRAAHMSRNKWPGGLVKQDSAAVLSWNTDFRRNGLRLRGGTGAPH